MLFVSWVDTTYSFFFTNFNLKLYLNFATSFNAYVFLYALTIQSMQAYICYSTKFIFLWNICMLNTNTDSVWVELVTLYSQVSLLNPLSKIQAKDFLPPLAKPCGICLYSSILKSYHFSILLHEILQGLCKGWFCFSTFN